MLNAKLAAALLSVATAVSAHASAEEDQWACHATARGERDSYVQVTMQLTTSGNVLSTYVSWVPPVIGESIPARPYFNSPDVSFLFDRAQRSLIGPVTNMILEASTLGGPDSALQGMRLSLTVDAVGPWSVELPLNGVGPDYTIGEHRLIQRSAFLSERAAIASVHNATNASVSLTDSSSQVIVQTQYDLSDTTRRDSLFATAWADAERLALHPEQCDKADGELPPELVPPLPPIELE